MMNTPPPLPENSDNPYQATKVDLTPGSTESDNLEDYLATKSSRFIASLIDGFIAIIVSIPIWFVLGIFDNLSNGQQLSIANQVVMVAYGIFMYVVVHGYLLKKSGQTVGKRLMGIYIADILSREKADIVTLLAKRMLFKMLLPSIPIIGPFLNLVNILLIFREDRRCGHDHIAGTCVLKTDD